MLNVSSVLLSIAANFDKVAVLCHKEGCNGLLERWPMEFRNRIHIFDGAQIDPMSIELIGERNLSKKDKPHVFLVTMSHIHVANTLFTDNQTSSYLFLEEDYEVLQPNNSSGVSLNDPASNIARFTEKDESWQFLRLGYNPAIWQTLGTKAVRCKAACLCQTVCDGICSITAGTFAKKSTCWIRSTVGYAVHRRAWTALQKLGKCSMGESDLSIDNWLPGFSKICTNRLPVHYIIPGVLYQNVSRDTSKRVHSQAMEGFASKCATSLDHSSTRNTSAGQLAANHRFPKSARKNENNRKEKDKKRNRIPL